MASASPTSPTRLRQIALVASDLPKAKETISYILGTELLYIDPLVSQWGLENALYSLGGDVLEIVSPFREDTTASRLLKKRGDGGYMIIMQTNNAAARRSYLESKGLAKVIFSHETDESACIQYHPKGIKGGVMPELDSHNPSSENPTPLTSPFSPWHACGPSSLYTTYSAVMARNSHLQLQKVVCRLSAGDDAEQASKQWESLFGIARASHTELQFLNARMEFVRGGLGVQDGIESITLGVVGKEKLDGILGRAREKKLLTEEGHIDMVGVKWYFELAEESPEKAKL